jgi:GH24 family phage-related lysozyme (muramidase)
MQSSVQQNFLQFTKPLEGTVNYMYLDIKGLVTVGIGNLIDPVSSASALPFVHNTDNSPALQSEIQAEWTKVKNNAALAQQGYKAAAPPLTTLHLTDASISQLVTNQLNAVQATLKQTFTGFESWPADAQLGVLSMAWALGAGFASTWPVFKAACLSQNWSAAAQNCQISTAGNAGVGPRNTADVLLFNNAQAVASQKLDPSVLHWPNTVPASSSSGSGSSTGGTSAVSNGSSGNGNAAGAAGGTAGSAGSGSSGTATTGSKGGGQSAGSGSTTNSGTTNNSSSPTTDTGDSGTTDTPTDDNTTGGDDTTSPTSDSSTTDTPTGDNTTGGDDATSPTSDSSTSDTPTGGDTSSDPAGTSSPADGSEGAGGGSDGDGTAVTSGPDATGTPDGSDDPATAEPVGASS